MGHTLSSDPPEGPPWATASPLLLSLLKVKLLNLVGSLWAQANLHPVLGGVHALEPLEAAQYPVKTHTRHQKTSIKLVIFTWNMGSENNQSLEHLMTDLDSIS